MAAALTLPDVTTTGAATAITTAPTYAKWVMFTSNSQPSRLGDANVTASRGAGIASGQTVVWPPLPDPNDKYRLDQIFAFITGGGTLSVTYGA